MTAVLKRILRIRTLLEDVSRAELAIQTKQVARIEDAIRVEAEAGRALRAQSFADLIRTPQAPETSAVAGLPPHAGERRSIAAAEQMLRERRVTHLEALKRRENRRLLASREEFLNRRKERRQIEALVRAQMKIREHKVGHREQSVLDEWFARSRSRTSRSGYPSEPLFPE
jgi:hypothetical protein